ncbi:hypothetical protein Tco_1338959, partial [Tanacetum coccineum]
MAPLLAADQRHPWLRYEVEGFTPGIVHSYEQRLETIWSRPVNWVHVLDFEGLTPEMRHDLAVRLRIVYSREGHTCRVSDTEMGLDVMDTLCFQLGGARRKMTSDRLTPDNGDLRDYWMEISSGRDFLGPAPSYVLIRDPVRRLCHKMIAYSISGRGQAPEKVTGVDLFYLRSIDRGTTNVPHLLAQYLFRHVEGRRSGARLLGGHFIRRLAMHFRLLGRLHICTRYGDTWAWIAQGLERQQAAAASAPEADDVDQVVDEVAPEIPAAAPTPAQAPPPPLPAPHPRTMSQRIE